MKRKPQKPATRIIAKGENGARARYYAASDAKLAAITPTRTISDWYGDDDAIRVELGQNYNQNKEGQF